VSGGLGGLRLAGVLVGGASGPAGCLVEGLSGLNAALGKLVVNARIYVTGVAVF